MRIWDASGEKLALPAGVGGISALAFSPDGRTLVAAGFDTDIRAWSIRDGELLRLMDELPLATFAMAFSPDGKYLATGGADRIVYLWDTNTWKISRKLSGQPELINALAFSPDGRILLTGGFSEFAMQNPVKALLWDIQSGKPFRSMPIAHTVRSAAFSAEGDRVAIAGIDKTISIWMVPPTSAR
jgi:WD40 repeat protein